MHFRFVISLSFVLILLVVVFGYVYWPRDSVETAPQLSGVSTRTLVNEKGQPWGPLAQGAQVYRITQAAGRLPEISEATIDPPDVHVGDVQKLSIVLRSPNEITSVEARTELDNSTFTLPLELVGPSGDVGLKYSGEWTVRDTHDEFYNTTFVAKDAAGNENSITLAWSDACGIPNGGNWTMTTNCTISATASSTADGVDNGNVTIASGTLVINPGVTFAWNASPQRTITLSGGSIAIAEGGQLKQTNLWVSGTDADGDGYVTGNLSDQVAADSNPGSYVRRYTITGTNDCYDSGTGAANVHPGQTNYSTSSYGGGGSFNIIDPASYTAIGPFGDKDGNHYCAQNQVACGLIHTNGGNVYNYVQLKCCALTAEAQSAGYLTGSHTDGNTYNIDSGSGGGSLYCGGSDVLVGAQWAKDGQVDFGRCRVPTGLSLAATRQVAIGSTCNANEVGHGAYNYSGKNDAWGGIYCSAFDTSSFDYNCDGSESVQYGTVSGGCNQADCSLISDGWQTSVPACGASGNWLEQASGGCYGMPFSCSVGGISRTQACR